MGEEQPTTEPSSAQHARGVGFGLTFTALGLLVIAGACIAGLIFL